MDGNRIANAAKSRQATHELLVNVSARRQRPALNRGNSVPRDYQPS
jgi:hypothetical protein